MERFTTKFRFQTDATICVTSKEAGAKNMLATAIKLHENCSMFIQVLCHRKTLVYATSKYFLKSLYEFMGRPMYKDEKLRLEMGNLKFARDICRSETSALSFVSYFQITVSMNLS